MTISMTMANKIVIMAMKMRIVIATNIMMMMMMVMIMMTATIMRMMMVIEGMVQSRFIIGNKQECLFSIADLLSLSSATLL